MAPTRVLIIDDDDAMRRLAVTLLALEGYDVAAAHDAESGRAQVTRRAPDVILMDRDLPGMSGLELTRQLKANPRTQSIMILAFSCSDSREDDAEAVAAGSDGFAAKPFEAPVLARTIAWYAAVRASRLGIRRSSPFKHDAVPFERPLGAATTRTPAGIRANGA
jgi:CheY-like chemotaxis protein